MIKSFTFSSLLLLTAITTFSQQESDQTKKFYEFLGVEKANILKETIGYFNDFLNNNYDTITRREDKIYTFLNTILLNNGFSFEPKWQFNTEINKAIIQNFEKSGLRKDVLIYGKELINEDTLTFNYVKRFIAEKEPNYKMRERGYEFSDELMIPLDADSLELARMEEDRIQFENSLDFRNYSLTMFGLDIYPSSDPSIRDYVESRFQEGSPNYTLLEKLLTFERKCYLDPVCEIILVMDYFFPLLYANQDI